MESSFYLPIFLIAGGIIFLIIFFHYVPFFLWLSAKVSGVNISLIQLFLMRIRNVPPYIIVPGMIEAHKAEKYHPRRTGSPLSGWRTRRKGSSRLSIGIESQHRIAFPDGYCYRPGRT